MQNSPARSGIDVGSVIADTYTIEALIGRGGMGAVFMASHKRLPGKKVAIKLLHAEMSGDEVLARFKREAEIASRLGHPNIVQVHDFNLMADGTPYLVLEYLEGESLAQRIKRGPVPIDQAMSIVRQIGSALAAAHREGIVHRDLKPQNIFLVPMEVDGRIVEIAKVLDFGISKIRGSTTVKTQDTALLGTPQYMAPEQATGQHKHVDERTDVFAFGAIVYEMLTGQPAFSGETIPEVVFKVVYEQPAQLATHAPTVSSEMATAVHRAMAKAAPDRFDSVNSFVEALTGVPLPPPGRTGTSIPPVDTTGPRTPNTGKEAFDATLGSGDHGAGGNATLPAASPPPPIVRPNAPTVPSHGDVGNAGTISAGPTPPSSKRGVVIAVAVLGAAAMAAVVMYFVMRDDKPKAAQMTELSTTTVEVSNEPVDQGAADEAADRADAAKTEAAKMEAAKTEAAKTEAAKVDAAKADAAKTEAAKAAAKQDKAEAKPDKKPPVRTVPEAGDDSDAGDDAASGKLREARQALDNEKWKNAETAASSVLTSPDATPQQKSRALLMYGKAQCGMNDEGNALATLRKLRGMPKLRRQLIEDCRAKGFLTNER